MRNSSTLISMSVLLISSFVLSSCTLPEPQDNPESTAATFILDSSEGHSRSVQYASRLQIPQSRNYEFKACFKDRAYLRPLAIQKIRIQENAQEIWTDTTGCAVWSESVAFNYFENPHYVQLDRHIEGQGYNQGVTTFKVAVNPWELPGDSTDVIDLKSITLESLNLQARTSDVSPRAFIKTLRLERLSQQMSEQGLRVSHLVRIEPVIERKNIHGEMIQVPVLGSEMQVHAKINYPSQTLFDGNLTFRLQNGTWQANLDMTHQTSSNENQATAQVTIQEELLNHYVTASDFTLGLGTDWVQGTQSTSNNASTNATTSAPAPVTSSQVSNSNRNASGDQSQSVLSENSAILVDRIESHIVRVISNREANREVLLSVKLCLKNRITHQAINQTALAVDLWQEKTAQIRTDDQGCALLEQSYQYQETSCHAYTQTNLKLHMQGSQGSVEIPVFIFPWSDSAPVIDGRYANTSEMPTSCANTSRTGVATGPDLILANVRVTPLEQHMSVGQLLELQLNKRFRFEASPQLQIQGGASSQVTYSPISDETWNVEILIQNPWAPARVKKVAYSQKNVSSVSGLLVWDMDITTNDLQTLNGPIEFFIHMENTSHTHRSAIFRARALITGSATTLALESMNGVWANMLRWSAQQDELITRIRAETASVSNAEHYARFNNLNLTRGGFFANVGIPNVWSATNLSSTFRNNFDLATRFCLQWARATHPQASMAALGRWVPTCATQVQREFRRVFKITPVYAIDRVISSRPIGSEQRTINVSSSYFVGYSFSDSWRHGVELAVGGEAGAGVGTEPVRASAGVMGGYEVSWMQARTMDQGQRNSLNEGRNLIVSRYTMQSTVQPRERCLAVGINADLFSLQGHRFWFQRLWDHIRDSGPDDLRGGLQAIAGSRNLRQLTKGILVCESNRQPVYINDDYYLIGENRSDTALQNSLDVQALPWFMALRSQGDYQQILTILTQQIPRPQTEDFTEGNMQRLLFETNYFDSMSSTPGVWISHNAH